MPGTRTALQGLLADSAGTPSQPPAPPVGTVFVAAAVVDAKAPAIHSDFAVTANGLAVPVYSAKYANSYAYVSGVNPSFDWLGFCNFDCDGEVLITVKVSNRTVTSVKILPTASRITPTISGNTISFRITANQHFEVQVNGSEANPLYISANPIASTPAADANVTVYTPGFHDVGSVTLAAGKTIVIPDGCIVSGQFVLNNDCKILGRGIITNVNYAWGSGKPIISYGANSRISGITIVDSPGSMSRCGSPIIARSIGSKYSVGEIIPMVSIFTALRTDGCTIALSVAGMTA
ncbi:MAG: hypothetical protein IPK66_16105 [Rhodospirillales bacterium]|nr:hypothetical protein [Rhodospirillales bacterium]